MTTDRTDQRGRTARQPSHHYTLHLDFAATNAAAAQTVAVDLAEGLGLLRPEIETYSARLSTVDLRGDPQPVFCLAPGPAGAFCADLAGHSGWHAEAGINGLRWSRADGTG
jgi:hypothetical protein